MSRTNFDTLLEAGCHFGHLKRKWNPAMAPYIFMERNGIHIIDLHKTVAKVDEAAEALKQIAKSGKKVLFVATKKQAKQVVADKAASVNMPYVIERWPGGMLTNFPTIRKAVKKMTTIDKLTADGTYSNLSKREILQISRQRAKLDKTLGSIADLTRLALADFFLPLLAGASPAASISIFSAFLSSRPSIIAAQQASRITSTDLVASSFAGITKSMFVGSELVSTIPNTGIPKRLASRTAIFSFITSITNKADGRLDKSDEEAINAAKAAAFLKEDEEA